MYLLINPLNQVVVLASLAPIFADLVTDEFYTDTARVADPRPSSGLMPVEMDFPAESIAEYVMQDGAPVRIVPAPPPAVPLSVPAKTGLLVLHRHGILGPLRAAIDAMDEPARTEAQIQLERSDTFERYDPFTLALGQLAGLTDAQIDALFIEAGT